MPSTTSSAVSVVLDSSTVITPSPPTFSIASATSSPIAASLCAEIVATCAFSLRVVTGRDSAFSASIARLGAAVEAALEVDGAGAGDDVAHAVGEDRVRQDGRGAGAVADHVAGLLGRLAQHLRAEVLLGILEVEFLGDGDAVVADDRGAPFLLDQDGFRFRAERDAHRIGELASRRAGSSRARRSETELACVP